MKLEFACYVTPFTRILFIFLQVVGIDLGTTNSAVAAMEGGKPTIVTNAEGVFLLMILSVASSTRAASVRGCAVRSNMRTCFQPLCWGLMDTCDCRFLT